LCGIACVKRSQSGLSFAHVQYGRFFGDCPCSPDVQPGPARIDQSWGASGGRLQVYLKVLPLEQE